MKRCPVCRRIYQDDAQNFCLDDGTTLLAAPAGSFDLADAPTANFPYRGGAAPTQVLEAAPTTRNNPQAPTTPPPFLAMYPQRRNPLPWIIAGLAIVIIATVAVILATRSSSIVERDPGTPSHGASPGASPSITPTPTPSHLGWQTLRGDGFSIYMPGSPSRSEQTEPSLAGPITVHLYTAAQGYEAFMVGDTRYPDAVFAAGNTEQIMNGARDGAISSVEGQVISERTITLDGHSGREVTGTSPSRNLGFTLRMYIAKPQMFIMLYSQFDKDKPISEDGKRFLDSFQITQ